MGKKKDFLDNIDVEKAQQYLADNGVSIPGYVTTVNTEPEPIYKVKYLFGQLSKPIADFENYLNKIDYNKITEVDKLKITQLLQKLNDDIVFINSSFTNGWLDHIEATSSMCNTNCK